MKFKDGVKLDIRPEMAKALPLIEAAYQATVGREAVITSGTDGTHHVGSLHYKQLALDVRTRDLTPQQKDTVALALRVKLNGSGNRPYQVIVESDHIHIEYQPQ